jgi:predicted acylesterase/phospholipase RssA
LAALGEIDELVSVYTSVRDRDILGFRLGKSIACNAIWGVLTGKDSIFSTAPLHRTLHKFLTADHWRRLRSGRAQAWASTVNMQTGRIEYYGSHDEGMSREKFIGAMLASASIPVFMSRARIPGEADAWGNPYWFVDGGVKDLIPLGKAIREGARDITVIILGPEPPPVREEFKRLHKILLRTIDLQGQETGDNDLRFGKFITREIRWREDLYRNLCATLDRDKVDRAFATASGKDEPLQTDDGRSFASVSFKMIRPADSLGDALEFGPERMRACEQAGYEFAKSPANWTTIP